MRIGVYITGGEIACEKLDKGVCAFTVSSSGKRYVPEKHVKRSGVEAYSCATSEIEADKLKNWTETDQCIKACGLDRKSLGISSDSLIDSSSTQKLCSPRCYDSCTNIVDLFFDLVAVYLFPNYVKQKKQMNTGICEIRSSGFTAPGPISSLKYPAALLSAPAMVPY
ncbi:hypothetical protein ACOSQ2_027728 [Xanthoceras sorbifolium]